MKMKEGQTVDSMTPHQRMLGAETAPELADALTDEMKKNPKNCSDFSFFIDNSSWIIYMPGGSFELLGKLVDSLIPMHMAVCPHPETHHIPPTLP